MAYTNAWNVTDPPGSTQAAQIDDHIRKLRLDIDERMDDLTEDWSAVQPVKLKDVLAGVKTDVRLVIPSSSFVANDTDNVAWGSDGILSTVTIRASIIGIPIGATITLAEIIMSASQGAGLEWYLKRRAFEANPAEATNIATVIHGAGTLVISTSEELDHVVADNDILYIEVEDPTGFNTVRVLAARITYDTPRVDA